MESKEILDIWALDQKFAKSEEKKARGRKRLIDAVMEGL